MNRILSCINSWIFMILNKQKQPPEVFMKTVFLEVSHNSQENTCARVSFLSLRTQSLPQGCSFIKKETLAQAFSCEYCKISKNTFFKEQLRTTASN